MRKVILLLSLMLSVACAPENDPTSKYDADKYIPLDDKKILRQNYLPFDNLKLSTQNLSGQQWEGGKLNTIQVRLISKIKGLKNPGVAIKLGQNEELPSWLSFRLKEKKGNAQVFVLEGDPGKRTQKEKSVLSYEVLFRVTYNEIESGESVKEILSFYSSQMSQQLNLGIKSE